MAMDWLFGRRIDYSGESGITINLPSYVIDIDVALDIVRMMEKRREERLKSLEQQLTLLRLGRTPDGDTDVVIKRLEGQRDSLVAAAPQARLHPVSSPWATASIEPSYDVPVAEIARLGGAERARLDLSGAGVHVTMRKWVEPQVSTDGDISDVDLARSIASLIQGEGRRRPKLRQLTRFLPGFAALLITATYLWAVFTEPLPISVVAFMGFGVVGAWIAAVLAYRPILRRYNSWPPGHRFRERSRADVRARLANVEAGAIVAIITFLLTVVGTLLVAWLTGLLNLSN